METINPDEEHKKNIVWNAAVWFGIGLVVGIILMKVFVG